jgi:PAS domain S-box-containing protein
MPSVTAPSETNSVSRLAPAVAQATACLFTGSRDDRIGRSLAALGSSCGWQRVLLVDVHGKNNRHERRGWNSESMESVDPPALDSSEVERLRGGQVIVTSDSGWCEILVPVPRSAGMKFAILVSLAPDEEESEQTVEVLSIFAESMARVLELPVHLEHVQQRMRIDEALVQISHMLVASREIDFESLLRIIGLATGVDTAYFVRLPLDSDSLTDSGDGVEAPTVFRWTSSDGFQVEQVGEPVPASDGLTPALPGVAPAFAPANAVPVLSLGDRLFGYIGFEHASGSIRWRDEDRRVLGILGDILATFFERKIAERALQESEERWRRLVDHHPEPILLTSGHIIHYVNRAAVRVLGADERDDLVGTSFRDFISAEDFDRLDRRTLEIEKGGAPEPIEHEMIRFDGEERIVESASVPIMYEGKSFILTVMRDVTAQRLAEEGYRTFVETITEAICRIDLDRPIAKEVLPVLQRKHILEHSYLAECNDIMAELLGRRQSDVLGQPFNAILPHVRASILDEFIEGGYRLKNRELTVFRQNRSQRHFVLNAVGTLERGKLTRIWGSCIEVTERVELERRIMGALEEQQQEIGRDLHDGVGQLLTGVRMLTQNLVERFRDDDHPAFDVAEKVARFAEEATRHVRDIYRGLTPAQLYHEGLSATLAELAHTVDTLPNINCEFVHTGGTEIDNRDVKLHLFRIAQEAVNNALKHAKAENIRIFFGREGEHMVMRISDDGVGLHTPSDQKGTSIGFESMRYRAGAIGSVLDISALPDGGTCIECRLPIRH